MCFSLIYPGLSASDNLHGKGEMGLLYTAFVTAFRFVGLAAIEGTGKGLDVTGIGLGKKSIDSGTL